MPNVLTTASIINCPHQSGKLVLSAVPHKLKVLGSPVLVKTDITSATVLLCPNLPPPPSSQPCKHVTVSAGESSKLKVGGVPVMLDTLVGLPDCVPQLPPPAGNMKVTQVQNKLKAV
jgi:hypothetical protein